MADGTPLKTLAGTEEIGRDAIIGFVERR